MASFWPRLWIVIGALAGGTAVAMAAVTAHALPARLSEHARAAVQSAIQMQGWHALALVVTALWMLRAGPLPATLANMAAGAFALGIVLFCGSIYGADLAGIRIGPTAPAGGFLLMGGWLLLAASALVGGKPP